MRSHNLPYRQSGPHLTPPDRTRHNLHYRAVTEPPAFPRPGAPQNAAPAVGLAAGVARRGVLPTVTAAAAGRSTG